MKYKPHKQIASLSKKLATNLFFIYVTSACFFLTHGSCSAGEMKNSPFSLEFIYNYYFDYPYFDETYDSSKQNYKDAVLSSLLDSASNDFDTAFYWNRYAIGLRSKSNGSQSKAINWLSEHPNIRNTDDGVIFSDYIRYTGDPSALLALGGWFNREPARQFGTQFIRVNFFIRDLPKILVLSDSLGLDKIDSNRPYRDTDPVDIGGHLIKPNSDTTKK